MIDKEKIEESLNEFYPYLEGKEMIHPINYQRAKQRDAFLTGVEWAIKQVKNNSVLDDVISCKNCGSDKTKLIIEKRILCNDCVCSYYL